MVEEIHTKGLLNSRKIDVNKAITVYGRTLVTPEEASVRKALNEK